MMTTPHVIDIPRADGRQAVAALTEPPAGTASQAGIVLIHEWWGLNASMQETAQRIAAEGHTVLAVDLYRGQVTADPNTAGQMMNALDKADALQDIAACARWLGQGGRKVGVVGFCMGGALTVAAAVHVQPMHAAVCFYGIPPTELANPADVRVPFMGHFALQDSWCTPERAHQLEATMRAAGQQPSIHFYPARHAFFNARLPEAHQAEQAELAWARTCAFWAQHLKG